MGHDKLANVFKTNFALMHHHHWSLFDLENMMPWERYIYIDLLQQFLDEQEKERQIKEQERKAKIAQMERQAKMRK